jgi:hypothetical protein
MGRTSLAGIRRLPQSDETWQLARRRMRIWVTPPDEEPERPHIILCQSLGGPILLTDIAQARPPADEMLAALVKAMRTPAGSAGPPRRPQRVEVEEGELARALAPPLEKLAIACERAPLHLLDETLLDLETHMRGREPIPGLLASPDVTVDQVAAFFSAAALYYREAPWRWLSDSEPIAVRYPPTARERYAVLMGNAGIEYGLAVYGSWSVLQAVYAGRRPESVRPGVRWLAVMYDDITSMPFDDLDGLETYGWSIAGEDAYPIPLILSVKDAVRRPGPQELGVLEAVLRAIPVFVRDYLLAPDGKPRPVETSLDVPIAAGLAQVHLRFPATPGPSSRTIRARPKRRR